MSSYRQLPAEKSEELAVVSFFANYAIVGNIQMDSITSIDTGKHYLADDTHLAILGQHGYKVKNLSDRDSTPRTVAHAYLHSPELSFFFPSLDFIKFSCTCVFLGHALVHVNAWSLS